MAWVAIGAAAVGLAGNAYMSNKAEDAQYASSQQAMGLSSGQYEQVRDDTKTQRKVGNFAIEKLADVLGIKRPGPKRPERSDFHGDGGGEGRNKYLKALKKYENKKEKFNNRKRGVEALKFDPGYKFRLDNTNKTIDRYQSAGRVTGGRAIKEAMRYGQDFASGEFTNATNRLFTLAGYGNQAGSASQQAGQNYVNNASGILQNQGANQAVNYANMNNTIQGGLENAMTYKTYNDWTNKLNAPRTSSYNGPVVYGSSEGE